MENKIIQKNVLIIGHKGYIGSHLTKHLKLLGHEESKKRKTRFGTYATAAQN